MEEYSYNYLHATYTYTYNHRLSANKIWERASSRTIYNLRGLIILKPLSIGVGGLGVRSGGPPPYGLACAVAARAKTGARRWAGNC